MTPAYTWFNDTQVLPYLCVHVFRHSVLMIGVCLTPNYKHMCLTNKVNQHLPTGTSSGITNMFL